MDYHRQKKVIPMPHHFFFESSKAEEDFMRGDSLFPGDLVSQVGPVFNPAFDLIETSDKYTLLGDLPGLGINDLDIELKANILTVTGEREGEDLNNSLFCHALERTFGTFFRSFHLPDGVDGTACLARMKNGVLTIDISKRSPGPPRQEN